MNWAFPQVERARESYRRAITETNLAHQDAMNDLARERDLWLAFAAAGVAIGSAIVGVLVGLSDFVGSSVG